MHIIEILTTINTLKSNLKYLNLHNDSYISRPSSDRWRTQAFNSELLNCRDLLRQYYTIERYGGVVSPYLLYIVYKTYVLYIWNSGSFNDLDVH